MKNLKILISSFFILTFIGSFHVTAQDTIQNYIKKTVFFDEQKKLVTVDYYDGLGKMYESISIGETTLNNDVSRLFEYDVFGNITKEWLPTPLPFGNEGSFWPKDAIKTLAINDIYDDNNPYKENIYDGSSLSRTTKVFGPGYNWRSNKCIEKMVLSNDNTDPILSCPKFAINNSTQIIKGQNYNSDLLVINKTSDEDGNIKYDFIDKLDHLILSRQLDAGVVHDTYYIYDKFGNLCFVLPPMACDAIKSDSYSGSLSIENDVVLRSYSYFYAYDNYNRCIEKKLPGAEPVYMVYDHSDRLRLFQDGKQRNKNIWTFIKYDLFGRETIRGEYNSSQSRNDLQQILLNTDTTLYESFNISGTDFYTNNSYPTTLCKNLSIKYYDDYAFNNSYSLPAFFKSRMNTLSSIYSNPLKTTGYLTCTKEAVIGSGQIAYRWNAFFYDGMHDTPYKTLRSNIFQRIDLEELNMNFTGQVLSKSILHATSEIYITEYYTYTYDNAGRLKETKHRINTGNEVTLTNNSYNEIGQISSRTYGNGLETQTFDYNICGWLTGSDNELFSENLYYEKTVNNNDGYFNGNIRQSSFKYLTGNIHESDWRSNTNQWKENWETLDYTYDNLNRLTLAASDNAGRFSEQLGYDKHGNIKSLKRGGIVEHSWLDNGTTPNHVVGIIDSLSYNYNGNQLNDIVDNSNADAYYLGSQDLKQSSVSAPHCYFDGNGNMTTDLNKGIATIIYNSLNLPDTVQMRDGNMVTYVHDASGLKDQVVRHTIATSGVTIPIGKTLRNCDTLYSVSSYSYTQYAGNVVYDNSKVSRILLPDGILIRTNALTSSPPVFSYHHYLKDHLGNVRAVFEDDGEGGIVNQVNNYYPFGMEYGESAEDQTEVTYQNYLFGGKEFDRKYELNLSDFGARSYDATSGRWLTPDPLAEKYYNISPYAYCANNPVRFLDPTGMAYTYVWANEEKGEKSGYYVNDKGEKVEWEEISEWLNSSDKNKTDQDDNWGTLTLLANPGNGSMSSQIMGSGRFGHSWIETESKGGGITTYGTFGNMGNKEFFINYEKNNLYKAYKNEHTTIPITNKERLLIDLFNQKETNVDWSYTNNCTDYSVGLWNMISKDNLYPSSGIRTPTELYNLLQKMIPIYLPIKK